MNRYSNLEILSSRGVNICTYIHILSYVLLHMSIWSNFSPLLFSDNLDTFRLIFCNFQHLLFYYYFRFKFIELRFGSRWIFSAMAFIFKELEVLYHSSLFIHCNTVLYFYLFFSIIFFCCWKCGSIFLYSKFLKNWKIYGMLHARKIVLKKNMYLPKSTYVMIPDCHSLALLKFHYFSIWESHLQHNSFLLCFRK